MVADDEAGAVVFHEHVQGIGASEFAPLSRPCQKFEFDGSRMVWGRCFVRGPAMDTRRSFYLASKEDDFAEQAASRFNISDIPFIMPANDNSRARDSLSARCGSLLRRLIGLDLFQRQT
jgi:hypothetical protein